MLLEHDELKRQTVADVGFIRSRLQVCRLEQALQEAVIFGVQRHQPAEFSEAETAQCISMSGAGNELLHGPDATRANRIAAALTRVFNTPNVTVHPAANEAFRLHPFSAIL
jgi:hypothetical protein